MTQPLEVIKHFENKAASISKAVSKALQTNEALIAETPELFRGEYIIITPRPGDPAPTQFKRLMKIVNYDGTDYFTSLMVMAALMGLANPRFSIEIESIMAEQPSGDLQ